MRAFYEDPANTIYWDQADSGNEIWTAESHPFHCDLRGRMKDGESVVDFGCGGTHAFANLKSAGVRYTGIEWSPEQVARNRRREPDARYLAGNFLDDDLGLHASADWAISFFALEHTAFPHRMLKRMCDALRPGGRIAIICPDFRYGMASLRSGFRATTRRAKFKRLQWLDLAWHILDDRIFWPRRVRAIHASKMKMPIYLRPRCLDAPYYSDNDAVFLVTEDSVVDYLRSIGVEITIRSTGVNSPTARDFFFCYVIGTTAMTTAK